MAHLETCVKWKEKENEEKLKKKGRDRIERKIRENSRKKKEKGRAMRVRGLGKREKFSRFFDSQSSTVRELKTVHAMRASREYQNMRVLDREEKKGKQEKKKKNNGEPCV